MLSVVATAADIVFSYVTTNGTYYIGHPVDFLYPVGYALIALGAY